MKSRIMWLILSLLMALSLVLASCAKEVEEEEEEERPPPMEEEGVVEEEEEEGGLPPTGNWWDKFGEPEYGGTLVYREASLSPSFDVYTNPYGGQYQYYQENVGFYDWILDREIHAYNTRWAPAKYGVGMLAESWEMPDPETIIIQIRQGVHWQDKAPANGREFTADDVVFHYDRILGTGSGFNEPAPRFVGQPGAQLYEKVTATDKYTAVFKFKFPSAQGLTYLLEGWGENSIECPEAVNLYGDLTDWKKAVGTGPWILTDYVSGGSLTFSRNPNYWGYDERHTQNRLPYADWLKVLCIPDVATALAALRTGKIDMITNLRWEQSESLTRTNPELEQAVLPNAGQGIEFRVDREPFTDIKVRKALQMAIDREIIAETHFGGKIEGIPCGLMNPALREYCFPYDEWPQELKDEYSYNPARASELLAEAGYPDGFKTNCYVSSDQDLELIQIIKAYFLDIGVDMEIRVKDPASMMSFSFAREYDQLYWNPAGNTGAVVPPHIVINLRYSTSLSNYPCVNDPAYDAIVDKYKSAIDPNELPRLMAEADRYAIERHWSQHIFPTIFYNAWQPYLKGYSGENTGAAWRAGWLWSRLWMDQELKESMGR